ncbi:MAG: oxidoreductase family protein [Dehalococcoidia bacterium]
MTTTNIPAGVAAVTVDWLNEVMAPSLPAGTRIESFDSTVIGEGVGFLGELARVRPAYAGAGAAEAPASLIVKLPTQVPEPRGMAGMLGLYEREIGFYKELAPKLTVRIPTAYHAEYHAADANFALILEDIQGAKVGDQLASCPIDQATLAVRELAKSHAAWWQSDALASYPWLPSRGHPFYQYLKAGHIQGLTVFQEKFSSHFDPMITRCVVGLGEKYDEYLESLFDRPLTLVHGDYRLDNMMFGAAGSPNEFVVLDWQLCSMGLNTQDLQYFISGNLKKDAIAANTEMLLDTYHETLRQAGVAGYSRQQLADDYARTSLLLGFYIVTGITTIDPEAYSQRGHDLIEALFGSLVDSMLRYEAERFLPA